MAKQKEVRDVPVKLHNNLFMASNRLLELQAQRLLCFGIYKLEIDESKELSIVRFSQSDFNDFYGIKSDNLNTLVKSARTIVKHTFESIDENTGDFIISSFVTEARRVGDQIELEFKTKRFAEAIELAKTQMAIYGARELGSFQCKYTMPLLEYVKTKLWGANSSHTFTLQEFRDLFKLDDTEYQNNKDFKVNVWAKAMNEINELTQCIVSVKAEGRGSRTKYILTCEQIEKVLNIGNDWRQTTIDEFIDSPKKGVNRKYRHEEPVPTYTQGDLNEVTDEMIKANLAELRKAKGN